ADFLSANSARLTCAVQAKSSHSGKGGLHLDQDWELGFQRHLPVFSGVSLPAVPDPARCGQCQPTASKLPWRGFGIVVQALTGYPPTSLYPPSTSIGTT